MQNLPAERTQKIPLFLQWFRKNSAIKIESSPLKQNSIFPFQTTKKTVLPGWYGKDGFSCISDSFFDKFLKRSPKHLTFRPSCIIIPVVICLFLLNFSFNFAKVAYKFTESLVQQNFNKRKGMQLGKKIRELRQQYNLTQGELADRCELTKGYISQLENDLTSPSIATLTDILNALGSNLSDFFRDALEEKIVYSQEEYIEKQTEGMIWNWLIPNAQKNMMEPVLVELQPGAFAPDDYPHEGEEFGFVLEGRIAILVGGKSYVAKKGESFYYTANREHHIVNKGKGRAKFLWISTPPNF